MVETDKLFKVECRGMRSNSTGITYGISYVVAKNSNEAYIKVRNYLDDNDIGFDKDRELLSVELIAEQYAFTNTGTILYL